MSRYQKIADPELDNFARLREFLERENPAGDIPLYRKGAKGIKSSQIGAWFWDERMNKISLSWVDFRLSKAGLEFEVGSGLDFEALSGTLEWIDGEGPRITDGDGAYNIGINTDGGQPLSLNLNGVMSYNTSGGVPVAGDGAMVGMLHDDDDFTGGGLLYNAAWYLGVRIDDIGGGLNDTSISLPRPENASDIKYMVWTEPASNFASGFVNVQTEDAANHPPESFGAILFTGRVTPDGRFGARAIRSGGGAADLTLHSVRYSWSP